MQSFTIKAGEGILRRTEDPLVTPIEGRILLDEYLVGKQQNIRLVDVTDCSSLIPMSANSWCGANSRIGICRKGLVQMQKFGCARRRVAGNVVILLGVMLSPFARAQSCHPIEGWWQLRLHASQIGESLSFDPYYTVRAIQLRLRTVAGRINERWSFKGRHLHESWSYSFRPDGHTYPTYTHSVLYSVPTSIVAHWQNCTLLVDGYSSLFGLRISTLSTYVFAPDGRILTILQSSESRIMHVSRRLVFTQIEPVKAATSRH